MNLVKLKGSFAKMSCLEYYENNLFALILLIKR